MLETKVPESILHIRWDLRSITNEGHNICNSSKAWTSQAKRHKPSLPSLLWLFYPLINFTKIQLYNDHFYHHGHDHHGVCSHHGYHNNDDRGHCSHLIMMIIDHGHHSLNAGLGHHGHHSHNDHSWKFLRVTTYEICQKNA